MNRIFTSKIMKISKTFNHIYIYIQKLFTRINEIDGGKGYAPRYEQKQLQCLPNSQTNSSQIKIQYIYIYIYIYIKALPHQKYKNK